MASRWVEKQQQQQQRTSKNIEWHSMHYYMIPPSFIEIVAHKQHANQMSVKERNIQVMYEYHIHSIFLNVHHVD